jgi:tRNA(fMet)-specific endonuclease VapC
MIPKHGKYLADTNVIIRLLRADEYTIALFNQANRICIPAIVAGELFYGACKSPKKRTNIDILADFLSQYEIIVVDETIARVYGEIREQVRKDGYTLPENDLWIAASAKAYQYTLITFDTHFKNVDGLHIIQ